jgi:hypothetical protein
MTILSDLPPIKKKKYKKNKKIFQNNFNCFGRFILKITLITNKMQEEEPQLNIEISDEVAEGVYSNLVSIAHSNSEFVLDFIRVMPNMPKGKVKSRIIITPDHAKRLLSALADNINKYETTFGTIEAGNNDFSIPMNFGGSMGEA